MKTSQLSQGQNEITTINLLRERAAEFLRVADNLEAHSKFVNYSAGGIGGNRGTVIGMGRTPPRRPMPLATRRKIAKANRARAAQKKLAVVGKAA
jgi:hypothetical protein